MINKRDVKEYCFGDISKIENYDKAIADESQTWVCHHRLEIQDGVLIFTPQELIDIGRYWKVPTSELIFLTKSEHSNLHGKARAGKNNPMFGKRHSAETIEKMREAKQGEKHPIFGKHRSAEAIEKIRQASLGKKMSDEAKEKTDELSSADVGGTMAKSANLPRNAQEPALSKAGFHLSK